MRSSTFAVILLLGCFCVTTNAQHKAAAKPKPIATSSVRANKRSPEVGQTAVVVDETLSVLRKEPSLFSESVHRMQRGRKVQILGTAEADGVKFYKVSAPPASMGWVQADAVFGKFRAGDEERFARLVQALDGFDQIEAASEFFALYPESKLKPPILLLFGDVLEEVAVKLTKDANSKLKRPQMAASAAPMHSYFLNFVSLDRYRKLGVIYLFNSNTRAYHYDGASWKEIVERYPDSTESPEARKRLETLKTKMAKPPTP